MSRNRAALSALFLVLLALTLGPKLLLAGRLAPPDDVPLAATLAERLRRIGFDTVVERKPISVVVTGRRGACRIALRRGDNASAFAPVYARWARETGALLYAYRGALTATPPGLRPRIDMLVQNQLIAIGIAIDRPAVIVVARAPACGSLLPDLADVVISPVRVR